MSRKADLERVRRHEQFENIFRTVQSKGVDPFTVGFEHEENTPPTVKERFVGKIEDIKDSLDQSLVHRPSEEISEFDPYLNMATKGYEEKASPLDPKTWFGRKTVTETRSVPPKKSDSDIRENLIWRLKNIGEERGVDRLGLGAHLESLPFETIKQIAKKEGIVLYSDGNKIIFS